jgi:flagellar motor switch/type III secretory pathway protein FliN
VTVRAYPWATLEPVARVDATATRAMRAWAARFAREDQLARVAGELVGARIEVIVKSVRGSDKRRTARGEADVAVILGGEGADLSRASLVEAEAALAAALVARAIRRDAPRVVDPAAAASGALAGAFGAVVVAVARRAHGSFAPRVLAAGPAGALARDLESTAGDLLEATLTVLVDDEAYAARILASRAAAMSAAGPPWTKATLVQLGDTPLTMTIVATATLSNATDVGTLRRGDAWLPSGWRLTRTASGALTGPVLLAAPTHDAGFHADLGEDGRIVVRGGVENLGWAAESPESGAAMSDGGTEAENDALVDAVGEVPVVVRVEIGTAEMRAREWASLGRGDVIALGRKIGESVTLRVGGVAVARGELVDLDGEIGVRILGRAEDR